MKDNMFWAIVALGTVIILQWITIMMMLAMWGDV